MYKKKSESVTHIWVTGGSEESIIFIKFTKCCYFHYLCGPICPTAPPSLHKALENGVAGRFVGHFVHRLARKLTKTYSDSVLGITRLSAHRQSRIFAL